MTTARRAEENAHDTLRDAIRAASLTLWDRRRAEAEAEADVDEDFELDVWTSTRSEVETGVLVDYVVVAVFDSGSDSHTVSSILRTDGKCASYRTVGLLQQGVHDFLDG